MHGAQMVTEFNKFNEDEFLRMKRRQRKSSPNLISIYQSHVKNAFPRGKPKEELLVSNTFSGEDEIDYSNFCNIFKDLPWSEVNLNLLYEKYSQFTYLTDSGWFFYLPAFLSFFNDLTASDLDLFERFVERICDSDFILKNQDRELTIEQSKLVAIFLTNTANFSTNSYASQLAQDSITSHWGTYLMV